MAKTLVITGGTGRLGSMIARVAHEHWDDLQEIRLLDLNSPEESMLSELTSETGGPQVNFIQGNITDEECLQRAFANADVVVHCAAVIETGSIFSRKKMKEVNAKGSCNVVQACLKSGVQALVYTGSLAQVCVQKTESIVYDETYEPVTNKQLVFSEYGPSKTEGEKYVLSANGQTGKGGVILRTCSIRCPGMYGEGDTIFIGRLVRIARNYLYNTMLVVGHSNEKSVQVAYIGNCAWAHVVAARKLLDINKTTLHSISSNGTSNGSVKSIEAQSNCIGGKFYFVADHTPRKPLVRLYEKFLIPLGQRVFSFQVPFAFIWLLAMLLDYLALLFYFIGIDLYAPLNMCSIKYFRIDHGISWDKAKRELKYEPLYDYQTSLARSLAFYKQKYLK